MSGRMPPEQVAGCVGMRTLAEFERSLIRERVMAGLAASDKKSGRHPVPPDAIEHARVLIASGKYSVTDAADKVGIGRATVYKYLPGGKSAALSGKTRALPST